MKIFLQITIILLSFSSLFSQVTIRGTVVGADSKPIENGIVAFIKRENMPYTVSKPISNGTFEVVFEDRDKTIYLLIGAPFHAPTTMVLPSYEDKIIDVKVKLQALTLPTDGVKIITDIDGFDFEKSKNMSKNNDGTYTYEISTDKKAVKYQILYNFKHKGFYDYLPQQSQRSSHGTMGELSEDMGGDYLSTVQVENGKATIIFDPQKLISFTDDYYAQITNEPLQSKLDLVFEFNKMYYEYNNKLNKYLESNKSTQGFIYDISKWNDYIDSKKSKNSFEELKLLYEVYYLKSKRFYENDPKLSSTFKGSVGVNFFKNVPYSNPLWVSQGEILTDVLTIVFKDSIEQKFKEVVKFCKESEDIDKKAIIYSTLLEEITSKKSLLHKEVYEKALSDLNGYKYINNLIFRYNPDKRIAIGKPVPDFEIASLENASQTISNKTLKGQYYLIDFWATWCGPCMAEMGNLHQAYEKFKGKKGFTILSLSYDGSPDKVVEHRKKGKYPMPWNHGFVQDGFESKLGQTFEVAGIPSVVLVDDKGTIIATSSELRGASLENTLKKFLE